MKNYVRAIVSICIFLVVAAPAIALDSTQLDNTISELQQKITDLQGQESSLSKQITLLNSQISLSNLKITQTRGTIDTLTEEISGLNIQIDELEKKKTHQLELVLHRTPEAYKRSRMPLFGLLLFSTSFSDVLTRAKYLASVQEQDVKSYRQLQLVQNSYNERRDQREKKKAQLVSLKQQLEKETRELDRQKREKQVLLEQTKNSESVYQQLLAQALAEAEALKRALVEGVKVGPIKQGDPIAIVGNTGWNPNPNLSCSTGSHLHFEIQKNGAWVDPSGYLSSKTVLDIQDVPVGVNWSVGNGGWQWPLQDNIRLTQHFGKTPYSWQYGYSGGIHTGYDMVSSSSEIIRAPQDGTLYSSSSLCRGSTIIKVKYIDHGDGVLSFYLHVQ